MRRRAKKEAAESGENLTIDLSSLWIRVLAPFLLTQLYCADKAHKYAIPQRHIWLEHFYAFTEKSNQSPCTWVFLYSFLKAETTNLAKQIKLNIFYMVFLNNSVPKYISKYHTTT